MVTSAVLTLLGSHLVGDTLCFQRLSSGFHIPELHHSLPFQPHGQKSGTGAVGLSELWKAQKIYKTESETMLAGSGGLREKFAGLCNLCLVSRDHEPATLHRQALAGHGKRQEMTLLFSGSMWHQADVLGKATVWLLFLKPQTVMVGRGATLGGHISGKRKKEPRCFSGSPRFSWETSILSSSRIQNGRFRNNIVKISP